MFNNEADILSTTTTGTSAPDCIGIVAGLECKRQCFQPLHPEIKLAPLHVTRVFPDIADPGEVVGQGETALILNIPMSPPLARQLRSTLVPAVLRFATQSRRQLSKTCVA